MRKLHQNLWIGSYYIRMTVIYMHMWIRILCKINQSNFLDVLVCFIIFKGAVKIISLTKQKLPIGSPVLHHGNNPTSEYKKQKKFLHKGPSISQSPALLFVTSLLPHIHIWIFGITVLIVDYPVLPSQCELKLCYYIDVQANSSRG